MIGFSTGGTLKFVAWLSDVVDGCFVMVVVFEFVIWAGFVIRVTGASFFSFDGGLTFGASTVIFLFLVLSSSASYHKP